MLESLWKYKSDIDAFLLDYLQKKSRELSKVNPCGVDAVDHLAQFVTLGKTIRGSLTIFSYRMFKSNLPKGLMETAAALELFHSAFLIHDDIADQDTHRRGVDAIHIQYRKLTKNNHKGISLAIHLADLAIFLGWELVRPEVQSLVCQELANVCVAQMQDITGGGDREQIYRYKTARYTFSLPLAVGAMLAHAPTSMVAKLEKLGETLGLLYQIRDDQLDDEKKLIISVKKLYRRAKEQTELLPIAQTHKKTLLELATFCMVRKK